ncbi:MAG: hypothetical protein Q8N74_01340 [Sulfuricella sp.]|nr:hypothetical protein [Sulfuricella sp.]
MESGASRIPGIRCAASGIADEQPQGEAAIPVTGSGVRRVIPPIPLNPDYPLECSCL